MGYVYAPNDGKRLLTTHPIAILPPSLLPYHPSSPTHPQSGENESNQCMACHKVEISYECMPCT